jgi:hypothetical protein
MLRLLDITATYIERHQYDRSARPGEHTATPTRAFAYMGGDGTILPRSVTASDEKAQPEARKRFDFCLYQEKDRSALIRKFARDAPTGVEYQYEGTSITT